MNEQEKYELLAKLCYDLRFEIEHIQLPVVDALEVLQGRYTACAENAALPTEE